MNLSVLLSILFPRYCLGCRRITDAHAVCEACFLRIPRREPYPFGERAVGPYHDELRELSGRGSPRRQSSALSSAPYLISAALPYRDPACRSLIHALKFRGMRRAADTLADILAEHILQNRRALRGFEVIPIPLSRKRSRERGFNQSELIAKSFADRLALPFSQHIIIRVRHSGPQSEIPDFAGRKDNIAGAFVARESLHGRKFILIDDVTTTGATFLEAAHMLSYAGAQQVICLAAAKA